MDISGFLKDMPLYLQTLIATGFTYLLTAIGAGLVFLTGNVKRAFFDMMLGFAAGVMIAASYWSLLQPSIEMSSEMGYMPWLLPAIGFISGAVFLRIIDLLLPHLHGGFEITEAEGIRTQWKKTTLLFLAVTLHNIPEGMAVGVAFGANHAGMTSATLGGAVGLAIGIGIQNLPEGLAISMPLRREGFSRLKSFFYGQLSGMVEPLAGLFGAILVSIAMPFLPFIMSFAAGAMIFVTVEELIPESQRSGNSDIATTGLVAGFTLMMILDIGLK